MKFKKWLENFWYHYKWPVIIGAFFVIVASVCFSQMATKESYDMYIRYVGDNEITRESYQDIKNSFERTKLDANGDKKTAVAFDQVVYISDTENVLINEMNAIAKDTLSALVAQSYYIYLMDTAAYEVYADYGAFEELGKIFETDMSDIAYDEYAVYFNQTEFYKNNPGMEWVDDDVILVLKIAPFKMSTTPTKHAAEIESFEFHKALFKLMIEG